MSIYNRVFLIKCIKRLLTFAIMVGLFFIAYQHDTADVFIYYPKNNDLITSPLVITGKVQFGRFFEDELFVELVDITGKVLVGDSIHQDGSYSNVNRKFFDFKTELKFDKTLTSSGVLIFQDTNQKTGEIYEVLKIPVRFK